MLRKQTRLSSPRINLALQTLMNCSRQISTNQWSCSYHLHRSIRKNSHIDGLVFPSGKNSRRVQYCPHCTFCFNTVFFDEIKNIKTKYSLRFTRENGNLLIKNKLIVIINQKCLYLLLIIN